MTTFSVQCPSCKHLKENTDLITCEAFPDEEKGVPYDILTGEFRHTKKHPEQDEDNNIVWKRK